VVVADLGNPYTAPVLRGLQASLEQADHMALVTEQSFLDRQDGFAEAAAERGLEAWSVAPASRPVFEEGRRLMELALAGGRQATGVFAHNDPMAMGAVRPAAHHHPPPRRRDRPPGRQGRPGRHPRPPGPRQRPPGPRRAGGPGQRGSLGTALSVPASPPGY
jgi:hypothetical protein